MQLTYTTKLKKGVAVDEQVITSRGYESTFTLKDIKDNIKKGEMALRENLANAEVQKAKVENIEAHHKFVTKMKDEDLHAAFMYFEAKVQLGKFAGNVKALKKAIKEEKDDLKEIIKQLPELDEQL